MVFEDGDIVFQVIELYGLIISSFYATTKTPKHENDHQQQEKAGYPVSAKRANKITDQHQNYQNGIKNQPLPAFMQYPSPTDIKVFFFGDNAMQILFVIRFHTTNITQK